MSVRSEKTSPLNHTEAMAAAISEAQPSDVALHEGSNYNVSSPEHPLQRNLVVSVRASLNDLCLQKTKGTWAPSAEALKSIFQQRKFTNLSGAADAQGDLKSIVLHNMEVTHVKSTFPCGMRHALCLPECAQGGTDSWGSINPHPVVRCALSAAVGARITGVDDKTFSSTGESYSTIVLPHAESTVAKKLQADDVSLGTLCLALLIRLLRVCTLLELLLAARLASCYEPCWGVRD